MAYSSIIRKSCKCGCGRNPDIGFKGYSNQCRPDLKEAIIAKQRKRNAAKLTGTKLRGLAYEQQEIKAPKDYAELDRWFKDRRKEMTGVCQHCGGKTQMNIDVTVKFVKGVGKITSPNYKYSVAHLLPKSIFKSVATHPDNWIELCHFGNSCHKNFDDHYIDLIDLNCFDTVIQKFTKIYPFIAPEEKRRIPPILIEYLKTEL